MASLRHCGISLMELPQTADSETCSSWTLNWEPFIQSYSVGAVTRDGGVEWVNFYGCKNLQKITWVCRIGIIATNLRRFIKIWFKIARNQACHQGRVEDTSADFSKRIIRNPRHWNSFWNSCDGWRQVEPATPTIITVLLFYNPDLSFLSQTYVITLHVLDGSLRCWICLVTTRSTRA